MLCAAAVIAGAATSSPSMRRAFAEAAPPQGPGQVALTAKQVEHLAAFKELSPLFEKLDQAGDKPDPKTTAAVEAAVKKYGFRDLAEYEAVANSIVAVMDGIDPKTKKYTDPIAAIKRKSRKSRRTRR